MIGFYNYSVILTYLGLALSVFGITESINVSGNCIVNGMLNGHFTIALLCLALAGACDTFDGKIARKMDRTHEAVLFGVQIDSLCDVICFGVFPAILAYSMGMRGFWGIFVAVGYVLAAVIRLAFFNVLDEIARNSPPTEGRKTYRGLPVTSIAIIFPIVFLLYAGKVLRYDLFITVLTVVMAITALLFVTDFKIKKPTNKTIAIYIIFVTLIMLKILHVF